MMAYSNWRPLLNNRQYTHIPFKYILKKDQFCLIQKIMVSKFYEIFSSQFDDLKKSHKYLFFGKSISALYKLCESEMLTQINIITTKMYTHTSVDKQSKRLRCLPNICILFVVVLRSISNNGRTDAKTRVLKTFK